MSLSRERAVFLSHELVDRLLKTPSLALTGEREFVRNQVVKALLDWDREYEKLQAEARKKLQARSRKVAEGSREWDLLLSEEIERALAALATRGE